MPLVEGKSSQTDRRYLSLGIEKAISDTRNKINEVVLAHTERKFEIKHQYKRYIGKVNRFIKANYPENEQFVTPVPESMPDDEVTQINLKTHDDENDDKTLDFTSVSPDGSYMAVWSEKKLLIYNLAHEHNKKAGELVREVAVDLESVLGKNQVFFCPNSETLVVIEAKRVWMCDIQSGNCTFEYAMPEKFADDSLQSIEAFTFISSSKNISNLLPY